MTDRLEEIRARHAQSDKNYIELESTWDIHADRAFLLAEVDRLRGALGLRDALRHAAEQDENERLRAALTDMLNGWRYIRETYGDLAGVGWDRAEQKAREALEGKP